MVRPRCGLRNIPINAVEGGEIQSRVEGAGGAPRAIVDSVIPGVARRGQRCAQRGVVAYTLLAPVRDMLFFFAEAIDDPAQALRFDALFAPECASSLVLGARAFQRFQVLAQ